MVLEAAKIFLDSESGGTEGQGGNHPNHPVIFHQLRYWLEKELL